MKPLDIKRDVFESWFKRGDVKIIFFMLLRGMTGIVRP